MVKQRELVLLSYPFSDLKSSKVRPVIVVSSDAYNQKFQDMIVVPVTSNLNFRDYALNLSGKDLETGHLITESVIKVDRITSIRQSFVIKPIGKVRSEVLDNIRRILNTII